MLKQTFRGAVAAAALFAVACSDASTGPGGDLSDRKAPTVKLAKGGTTLDTLVAFQVEVNDDLGIKSIKVNVSGGASLSYDTTFTTAATIAVVPFSLSVSRSIPKGTPVLVTSYALDGALNKSATDTLHLTVGDVPPAEVTLTSPPSGTIAVLGKSLVLSFNARSSVKVRSVGFRTSGSFEHVDSVTFGSPLPDSASTLDTLAIPANAPTGPLTISPFVIDSLGQRTIGPSVLLNVQSAAAINSVPVVNFRHTPRVEVNDTIHVTATDQTGIIAFGYEVRRTPNGAVEVADSLTSNGNITAQLKTFDMRLPYTSFPTTIYIKAFARNSNGTRTYAKDASGGERVDTVVVVAGATRPLPDGGDVADALYHPRHDRLYLTNIQRNQLEVFSLTDSSFKTPVIVGSRPWGIAAWPRNHSGTMGDTLLVANSGGTDISYVNLNAGSSGREVFRYQLPNIVVFTVTSKRSPAGFLVQERTRYDFSDRPQFIGTTCKGVGFECGDVVLTYSTTPTPGQSEPFNRNNGTLRWENLTARKSHFYFEQAIGQAVNASDTLEIVRYDGLTGDEEVLVPYQQEAYQGSNTVSFSVTVNPELLAFRDTTFVRNSGNFARAVYGESGNAEGSRAMTYDVNRGFEQTARMIDNSIATLQFPVIDRGISQATDVGDWIANSFAQVKGVAMNFDGSLAGVRADSTYLLNTQLRLQGILETTQANGGLDFHPLNSGPNSFPLATRLVFAASSEATIDIFDSYCYKKVSTVPIRDPIIGPIKAAVRPATGQIVLIGATKGGVVIVTLPDTFTTGCI